MCIVSMIELLVLVEISLPPTIFLDRILAFIMQQHTMYTCNQSAMSLIMKMDTESIHQCQESDNGALLRAGDHDDAFAYTSSSWCDRDMRRMSIDVNDETCAD